MWDAGLLISTAIPNALKSGAKPGTAEFRKALRDAIEQVKDLLASQGVFNMSPTDHSGFDERARVMVKVVAGKWTYQPDLSSCLFAPRFASCMPDGLLFRIEDPGV